MRAVVAQTAAFNQSFRPQFHFSPQRNWTNDPNGLVYFDGEYHLFFQFNPFGDRWGHMSWGHAVSRDLVHWRELPVAIPEANGIMIFTGSTVVDQHNSSGFCTAGRSCLVAVYTGHAPETPSHPAIQTQNLAYSNDRGRTWTKYAHNPVLDLHMSDFRDPKVFWFEQGHRWVMAVSLPNDHKIRFYGSADLKQWNALSDFGPAGATSGQWECPELFELPVAGQTQTRWVLKVGLNPGALQGGSGEQYFVGRFDGTRFVNDNAPAETLWTDYGKDCYCALTFNNLPKTQPAAMIGWMNNWQYAADVPTSPWRGQMTVPRDLKLAGGPGGLRLIEEPIAELKQLRKTHIALNANERRELDTDTFELASVITTGKASELGWRLLAADGTFTLVGYDREKRQLFVDRTHSGDTRFSKYFPIRTNAPLEIGDGKLRLHILVDRSSIEVFAQDGRIAMTNLVFPPRNARGIEFYSKGETGPVEAELWTLGSIW